MVKFRFLFLGYQNSAIRYLESILGSKQFPPGAAPFGFKGADFSSLRISSSSVPSVFSVVKDFPNPDGEAAAGAEVAPGESAFSQLVIRGSL